MPNLHGNRQLQPFSYANKHVYLPTLVRWRVTKRLTSIPTHSQLRFIQISTVSWNRRNTKLNRTQPHIHRRSDSSPRFSLNVCLLLGEGVKGTHNPEHRIYPSSHYVLTIKIRTRSLNLCVLIRAMSICHSLLTVSTQQHCCSLRHFPTHSTKTYTLRN